VSNAVDYRFGNPKTKQNTLEVDVREAKIALDFIHILTGHKCNDSLYSWAVQISGLQCKLSTMHLARNGLYVSVPQFEFSFPKDISELKSKPKFEVINFLFFWVTKMFPHEKTME
jgi:hypothetical protein